MWLTKPPAIAGALTTGNKTNRYVLTRPNGAYTVIQCMHRLAFADADDLQKKIERLRSRVHTLEDALRILQANVSDDQHPLLQGTPAFEYSGASPIPHPVINDPAPSNGNENILSREDEEFLDAFGTKFIIEILSGVVHAESS